MTSTQTRREGPAGGLPPQITLHGIGPSPAIERALRRKLAWLRRYYPRIMGCRVTVEAPHRHHRKGRLYRVRVEVTVPGGMDYARRQRGQVKAQAAMQRGSVRQLEADHGFLDAEDGRDVYFHRNSVVGDKGPQASTVAIVRPKSQRAAASAGRRER
jgi:hypothetical protein